MNRLILIGCGLLLALSGCIATQTDVGVVQEKVSYVEEDLYTTTKALVKRMDTIEENNKKSFSSLSTRVDNLEAQRAILADEITKLSAEIKEVSGKIDELNYAYNTQLKEGQETAQSKEFELRRDMEGLKKTYTDIITSISTLNQNLTAMQNDIFTINKAQVSIGEGLNTTSNDIQELTDKQTNMESKIDDTIQVFLNELTRQESELYYLKNQAEAKKTKTYIVKSGDSLGKIAEQFGTTISEIKKTNNLKSDIVYIGQKLTIP